MKDNNYVVFTDSCCDLNPDIIEDNNIKVIRMMFRVDEKDYYDYADNREMNPHTFYNKLRDGKLSKTTQITPITYIKELTPYLKDEKDIILTVFSSALSSTYNSAMTAAATLREEFPERKIEVIDTLSASGGQGFFVYNIAKNQAKGMSFEKNVKWALENRLHVAHWFTIDDLNFLRRGGRLTAGKAWLGTLLSLKPVLRVNDLGQLVPDQNVRGRKQSLLTMAKHFGETAIEPKKNAIMILHADDEKSAHFLGDLLVQKYEVPEIIYGDIGPVIGSHSGQDTIALFFFASKR